MDRMTNDRIEYFEQYAELLSEGALLSGLRELIQGMKTERSKKPSKTPRRKY